MKISASVSSSNSDHRVTVRTGAVPQSVAIAGKSDGKGSAINGGEFLMLALATCYCNDLYRESERLRIAIDRVEVEASADFPGIGLSAQNIRYQASIVSSALQSAIADLVRHTDTVAEVHNTIRNGAPVALTTWLSRTLEDAPDTWTCRETVADG